MSSADSVEQIARRVVLVLMMLLCVGAVVYIGRQYQRAITLSGFDDQNYEIAWGSALPSDTDWTRDVVVIQPR